MFKKGQKVTRFHACFANQQRTEIKVYITDYTVASWGKKQGTLIKTDGSNAEFRVYTEQEHRAFMGQEIVLTGSVDNDEFSRHLQVSMLEHDIEFIKQHRLTRPDVYNSAAMQLQIDNMEKLLAALR